MAHTTRKKEKNIGARISNEFFNELTAYLINLDMPMGELIRLSTREYMWSHPLPAEVKQRNKVKGKV